MCVLCTTGCASQVIVDGAGEPAATIAADCDDAGYYPAGPHGVAEGAVIRDFHLIALVDYVGPMPLRLCDFYNPEGRMDLPLALLINVDVAWSLPLQGERMDDLREHYAEYGPRGAEFLQVVAETNQVGMNAGRDLLFGWVEQFGNEFPVAVDETGLLQQELSTAYPTTMLVHTATMQIMTIVRGLPQDSFWAELDAMLEPAR